MAPYATEDVPGEVVEEDEEEDGFGVPLRGPCCCALERYEAKESGRSCVGEAGWAWGV